jgi:hypothetical protein
MIQRWLNFGADLTSHVWHWEGDNMAPYPILDVIAAHLRPGRAQIAKALGEHGARISARALSKFLSMSVDDDLDSESWKVM